VILRLGERQTDEFGKEFNEFVWPSHSYYLLGVGFYCMHQCRLSSK
jgi:hypothetical protein